jgi:hypothetical protein
LTRPSATAKVRRVVAVPEPNVARPADRRALRFRLLLLATSLCTGLVATEVVLRVVGGYRLASLRLQPGWAHGDDVQALLATNRDLVDRVLAHARGIAPELDGAWLATSPPPLRKRPVAASMQRALGDPSQLMFLCHVNEVLLRGLWQPGSGLSAVVGPGAPDEFVVFAPKDGSPHPLYRYPPSVTFPDGLTTNAFGFRGPEVAVDKPEHTVRIACVGASTTVDAHHFAWSHAELLPNWLDRWAAARGLAVRFEVLNAGREAIKSPDLRAIVRDEVLPLAVDYVVYYEGANQLGIADMLRTVRVDGAFVPGQPPPGVVPELAGVAPRGGGWLDGVAVWSATGERLRSLFEARSDLPEPVKPPQELAWPTGFDEATPDLAHAAGVAQLAAILRDLDAIRADVQAAGARLVLGSFCWLGDDGLRLNLRENRMAFWHLNSTFWPLRYATIRRLAEVQNRFFAAWARAHGVPFLDLAAGLPRDPRLYTDAFHATELGSRLRAWLVFAGLTRQIAADVAAGVVPVRDRSADRVHPGIGPTRTVTAAELDRR